MVRKYKRDWISTLSWSWASHVFRWTDSYWSQTVLEWKLRLGKRSVEDALREWWFSEIGWQCCQSLSWLLSSLLKTLIVGTKTFFQLWNAICRQQPLKVILSALTSFTPKTLQQISKNLWHVGYSISCDFPYSLDKLWHVGSRRGIYHFVKELFAVTPDYMGDSDYPYWC